LLGIKNIIVAINKMDLVDFSEERYNEIKTQYEDEVLKYLNTSHLAPSTSYIPISALDGDNIVTNSPKCQWYKDKPLMELLDTIKLSTTHLTLNTSFRLPVQYVTRPHLNFRGYCGTIASGEIRVGDSITVLPSKKTSKVKAIVSNDIKVLKPLSQDEPVETILHAYAPMATTLTLEDEIDISRGDMIVKTNELPEVSNAFSVMLVWMSEKPMKPNESYVIKRATSVMNGVFEEIAYKKDANTFEELETQQLEINDIAKCTLKLDRVIAVDAYETNRYTGSFIVIDRHSNETIGAGMIIKSVQSSEFRAQSREYTQAEIELNAYIRRHYPHWNCGEL
jgi:sulfate adenylyltransferase subunit 1